ncbi:hypothetical protein K490DRAFT_70111 [Saccharata proteae CBS 121410]|uniref:Uncharacterized protein n=1 Tax=Saccharata proteae CBS 121410 TaxID=1314787 RepID=A0A9P4HLS6_9PEZI|nr:hypothetical protein K490DRAFT_70111 [Saccharata proteae CBS 121410]
MVNFIRCGNVTAAQLRGAPAWVWDPADREDGFDIDLAVEVCSRCAQYAADGRVCNRDTGRCASCAGGHRGGCDNVPSVLVRRLHRVQALRAAYDAAVAAANNDDDGGAHAVDDQLALDCSRAQKRFTQELQQYRVDIANMGGLFGARTSRPVTPQDFQQLELIERRAANFESRADRAQRERHHQEHMAAIASAAAAPNPVLPLRRRRVRFT